MVDGIWMMFDVIQFFVKSCLKNQEAVILIPTFREKNLLNEAIKQNQMISEQVLLYHTKEFKTLKQVQGDRIIRRFR